MRGTGYESSTGLSATAWARLLSTALILTLLLPATVVAQEVCIPEDPYCGQEPNSSSPPDLSVQDTMVVVEEGQMAQNGGTFDDTFDADLGETVSFSASSGTVHWSGAESGSWQWSKSTDRDPPYQLEEERQETVTINATDSTGRSSSVSFALTVNPVPPTVELKSPTEGSFVRGTTKIVAQATDNIGIDLVEFYVNGEYAGYDLEAPYEFPWNTTAAADGPATLTARAYDLSGNAGEGSISVSVDNSVPEPPRILEPREGVRTTGAFTLRGYAEPGSTVEVFEGSESVGTVTADRYALWGLRVTGVPEGAHSYRAVATDRAGNVSAISEPRKIVADATKPKVIGVTPPHLARRVATTAHITAIFSEAMRASSVNRATFVLLRKGTTRPVPATVTYDPEHKKAVLNPDSKLRQGATYIATVRGGARGVKDLADNILDRSKTWSFRTR